MASIFDDPRLTEQIGKVFSRYTPEDPITSALKRGKEPPLSWAGDSWVGRIQPMTAGEGGLMPAQQRQAMNRLDEIREELSAKEKQEAAKRDREQKKILALAARHPEIRGVPFETYDEAMGYLRYLKSGRGEGGDVFGDAPAVPVIDQRLRGYNVGGIMGTKAEPMQLPKGVAARPFIQTQPQAQAPQMRQPRSQPQTKNVGGKMYVKNELGQWIIAR